MFLPGLLLLVFGIAIVIISFLLFKKPVTQWLNAGIGIFGIICGSLFLAIALFPHEPHQHADITRQKSDIVGQKAPELKYLIRNNEDATYQQSQLSHHNGQVVLINFWATWCPPCIKEMPDLSRLGEKYVDDLVVVSISDETPDEIEQFMEQFPDLTHQIGLLPENYEVDPPYDTMRGIRPVSFVVDREGVIVDYIRGARSFEVFESAVRIAM